MPAIALTHAHEITGGAARFVGLLVSVLLTACAITPDDADYQAPAPAVITINTIPAGADISIQGNYLGVSPLTVPAPAGYRSAEAWKIEARLPGYEIKNVAFGNYHPPVDQVLTRMVESASMIYSAPVGTKTIAAYYVLPDRIDIKLYPLPGYVPPAAARTYSNGDTYAGEFRGGQLNGKGVYQFTNGNRYEGEFRDNHIQGNGVFTCANGKIIPGPFSKLQPLGLVMKCD